MVTAVAVVVLVGGGKATLKPAPVGAQAEPSQSPNLPAHLPCRERWSRESSWRFPHTDLSSESHFLDGKPLRRDSSPSEAGGYTKGV